MRDRQRSRKALLLHLLVWGGVMMLFLSQSALAQRSDVRVLKSWNEPVKIGGVERMYRVDVIFDYGVGEARQRVYDAGGALVEEQVLRQQPHPTAEEREEAHALIRADAELARLIRQQGVVFDGGFILHEASGLPCGPGTRCLQIEMLSADRQRSVRFVAVDLVSGQIKHRNLHPGH